MTGIRMFMGLLIVFFATSAYAECYAVFGTLQLQPAGDCSELYDVSPLGEDFGKEEVYIGQCFKVISKGNAIFEGVSGLTSSPAVSILSEDTVTPISLNGERAGLSYFTGRGYLTGKILTRDGLKEGSITTVDAGTMDMDEEDGVAVEIIRIQGGEGDFEGASGRILVYGPELYPGWATYRGNICIGD